MNPETKGKPSNSVWLSVTNALLPWQAPAAPPVGEAKSTPLNEPPVTEPQKKAAAEAPSGETNKAAPITPDPKPDEPTIDFVEIVSMNVYCYQESLEKAFYFGFWDDANDFLDSSDEFNRILASTRFLS
jgi:hypothetical protein